MTGLGISFRGIPTSPNATLVKQHHVRTVKLVPRESEFTKYEPPGTCV